jgi:predicted ATPase
VLQSSVSSNDVKRGRSGRRERGVVDGWVRDALANLHDPAYLQRHPLAQAVHRDGFDGATSSAGQALRQILLEAIERLKPAANVAPSPHILRRSQILELRYAEGLDVPAVLRRLAIGKSLYYVEHERALAAVVAHLSERLRSVPLTPLIQPPSSFVGRERELAQVRQLLAAGRLLTLTGPPGTGKTRLGMEAAATLSSGFSDGMRVVPLAQLRSATLVMPEIARALGAPEAWGRRAVDHLAAVAATKQILLLLDNFEHVLDAAPQLVELLARCPGLKVLVTSRARLGVRGEQELAVPPLAVPEPDASLTVAAAACYPAVQLFTQRVREVHADFVLSDKVTPAVIGICRQLDGLPLAIELAAPRLKALTPAAMLARLGPTLPALPLLTAGARDLPERQQTMRRAIDWSYGLLGAREQMLFRRAAIFVGGFTLAAAHAVCAIDTVSEIDVLDGLTALVESSLVRQEVMPDGEPRFTMLRTLREYALEQLAAEGEVDHLSRRHAAYMLALAESAEPELRGPQGHAWFDRLEAEIDNLRAALHWYEAHQWAEDGLRLGVALYYFWHQRGHLAEGRSYLASLLALAPLPGRAVSTATRAKALLFAGALAYLQGDHFTSRALSDESASLWRTLGNPRELAWALRFLALVALRRGDPDARAIVDECLALFQETEDPRGLGQARWMLGMALLREGDAAARSHYEACLALFQQIGDEFWESVAFNGLAGITRDGGDFAAARRLYEHCLAIRQRLGNQQGIAIVQHNLGQVAQATGDLPQAQAYFRESLALLQHVGDHHGLAWGLAALASLAAATGQFDRAARLFGAATPHLDVDASPLHPPERTGYHRAIATARTALGEEAYAAAWSEGRAMTLEQAVADALHSGAP